MAIPNFFKKKPADSKLRLNDQDRLRLEELARAYQAYAKANWQLEKVRDVVSTSAFENLLSIYTDRENFKKILISIAKGLEVGEIEAKKAAELFLKFYRGDLKSRGGEVIGKSTQYQEEMRNHLTFFMPKLAEKLDFAPVKDQKKLMEESIKSIGRKLLDLKEDLKKANIKAGKPYKIF